MLRRFLTTAAETVATLRAQLLWLGALGVVLICVLFPPQAAHAATGINPQINFQGRLLNSSGVPVPDGSYNIEFKIYQDGTGLNDSSETRKWTEDYLNNAGNGVQVLNGYLSVQLGSINPFAGQVDFNQSVLWISMNIGNTNGSCTPYASCSPDGEMFPMKRLSANPYALNSQALNGLQSSQFVQLAQGLQTDASTLTTSIAINKTGSGNFIDLQASGTDEFVLSNSGNISLGGNVNHTLSVATAPASTTGGALTVSAGGGGTGAGALAGGTLTLQGGAGGGTNGAGGNLVVDAGAANGSGTDGTISIGTNHASAITIGKSGVTTTNGGALIVSTIGSGGTNLLCYNGSNQLSTCSAAPGSGSYIFNGTGLQTSANFNIQAATSGTAGTIGGIIRGASGGQTVDLLELQNSSGAVLANVDSGGNIFSSGNITAKSAALRVTDATGATIYTQISGSGGTYLLGSSQSFGGFNLAGVQTAVINTTAANVGLVVKGAASQTGNLFQLQDSSGNPLGGFNSTGQLYLGRASTTIGQINLFGSGSANSIALVGPAAPSSGSVLTLPNETGTLCSTGSVCSGYEASFATGAYIQNSTSLQASANLNIAGTGIVNSLEAGTRSYSTGTISQTGTTITGSGFTQAMSGGTIVYNDGTTANVTYVSATSLTSSVTKAVTAGSSYVIYYGGLDVSSTGNIIAQNTTNSTTAFQVQNAVGSDSLQVDTTDNYVGVGGTARTGTEVLGVNGDERLTGSLYMATGQSIKFGGIVAFDQNSTNVEIAAGSFDQGVSLYNNGSIQASISNNGQALFKNSANSTTAFQVQNQSGASILNVDTTNGVIGTAATNTASTASQNITFETGNATGATSGSGSLTIDTGTATGTAGNISIGTGAYTHNTTVGNTSGTSTLTLQGGSTAGVSTNGIGVVIATGSTFTNASSTLLTSKSLGDSGASTVVGGASTTANNTVDVATSFNVAQTTTGKTLTLPNPTNLTAGRIVYITNTGTASFIIYGVTTPPGTTQEFLWSGTAWTVNGAGITASYIQNTAGSATAQTSANFNIQATSSGTAGTVGGIIQGASGGQTADLLQFKNSAGSSVLLNVTAGGNINLAATTATGGQITQGGATLINTFGGNFFAGPSAGNLTLSGSGNTGLGGSSLAALTSGGNNTADGGDALLSNTTGSDNVAVGDFALQDNTSGIGNTAIGFVAGRSVLPANTNITGNANTFIGFEAGPGTTNQLQYATALGTNATVNNNNALSIGCVFGVDACTLNTNVGIDVADVQSRFQVQSDTTNGTGTITTSGTAVAGSGTATFTTQAKVGDTIVAAGQARRITAITNNTNLTVDTGFAPDIGSATTYGFTTPTQTISNTGAALFRNSVNSTTAFQIQNAAGSSNLFVADTTNSRIGLGITPSTGAGTGLLQVGASGSTNQANGISFGTDTVANLYRSAAGTIKTDGALAVVGALTVSNTAYVNTNSIIALKVEQSGVKSNVLVVDTTNAVVGINQVPVSTGAALQVTGAVTASGLVSSQNSLQLATSAANAGYVSHNAIVSSAGSVSVNDVVTMVNDTGTVPRVGDTTTAADPAVYGVITTTGTSTSGSTVTVATGGNFTVNAYGGASGINIGDHLVSYTAAGKVTSNNTSTTGVVGIALSTLAATTNGTVSIEIQPNGGETNPTVAGNLTVSGLGTSSFAGLLNANGGLGTGGAAIGTAGGAITTGAGNITSTGTVQGGTVNATSALQTAGTTRIDSSGNGSFGTVTVGTLDGSGNGVLCYDSSNKEIASCGSTLGSGSYIFNQSAAAQAANLWLQSNASASTPTAVIEQATSQTGDLLDFENTTGSSGIIASVDKSGNIKGQNINAVGQLQIGGANINTAGTLSNVAYLNAANVFVPTTDAAGVTVKQTAVGSPTGNIFAVQTNTGASNFIQVVSTAANTGNVAIASVGGSSTLTLTSQAGATWSTASGNLAIQSGGSGNLTLQAASGTVSLGSSTGLTAAAALGVSAGAGGTGNNSLTLSSAGTGSVIAKPGSDSAGAFQVQRAGSTTTVLDVDTTNQRVGVANGSPAHTLDVGGDVNTTGNYLVNGNNINTGGATPTLSNVAYLNAANTFGNTNTFSVQLVANGGITTNNAAITAGTANISSGSNTIQGNSTSALLVETSGGTVVTVLNADTTDKTVGVGTAATANNVLTVGTTATSTGAGGIDFGGDALANLYRLSSGVLKTDGSLTVAGTATDATLSVTNNATVGGTLSVGGQPASAASSSLVQFGATALGSNSNATGTYLGIDAPTTGSGSTADFLNFQNNNVVKLEVDRNGNFTTAGTYNGQTISSTASFTGTLAVGTLAASGASVLCYNGSNVLSTCAGGGNYIFNGTGSQANANFNIQSASSSSIGGIIKGAASQSVDLLELQNSSGTVLAKVDQNGVIGGANGSGSNIVGQALAIAGGQGTGTAAGGSLNFQVAKPGLTGSSLNPLATVFSLAGGASTNAGAALFKNSVDSTTGFQIQNSAAGVLLTADTSHSTLAVGNTANTGILLTVGTNTTAASGGIIFGTDTAAELFRSNTGVLSVSGGLTLGSIGGSTGTTVLCWNGAGSQIEGCTSGGGATNFIVNGVSLQTGSNFNIQSGATAGTPTAVIAAATSQTGDLLDFYNTAETTKLAKVDISGNITGTTVNGTGGNSVLKGAGSTSGSTAAEIQNSSGISLLYVRDDQKIGIGTTTPATALDVNGTVSVSGADSTTIGTPGTPTVVDNNGGGLCGGNWTYKVTALTPSGETAATAAVTGNNNPNSNETISWNAVSGATSYNVYRTATPTTVIIVCGTVTPSTTGLIGQVTATFTGVTTYSFTDNQQATINGNAAPAVDNSYSVGIGTTTPDYNLSVLGINGGGGIASIINTSTANTAGIQDLRLGLGAANNSTNDHFISYFRSATTDTNGVGIGNVAMGNAGVTYNNGSADFGEYFTKVGTVNLGDIVESTSSGVKEANNGNNLVGVDSNTTGFAGNYQEGDESNPDRTTIGMLGQVHTNVTLDNGPIAVGDPVTVSDIPGYGEKLSTSGNMVGTALEPFDPANGEGTADACPSGSPSGAVCGTIEVYIHPGAYDPTDGASVQGNGSADGDYSMLTTTNATIGNLTVTGTTTTHDLNVTGTETAANVTVTGTTTTQELAVTDTATIGTLNVTGTATLANLKVTGSTEVDNNLDLGAAPTNNGQPISSTNPSANPSSVGQSQNAVTKKFVASGAITAGSVVIADSSHDGQVTTTSTAGDTRVVGIAVNAAAAAGDVVQVAISGTVQAQAASTSITAGDLLTSSAQAGKLDKSAAPTVAGSIIGKALGKPDSNNLVWVLVALQ